jgi:phage shock protein E
MSILSIFGFGGSKIKSFLQKGAVVIDVRTPHEYDQGHVPGSINIPVDKVSANSNRILQMKKPVIFCCASGARSGSATSIMRAKGLKEALNGGSWMNVLKQKKSV